MIRITEFKKTLKTISATNTIFYYTIWTRCNKLIKLCSWIYEIKMGTRYIKFVLLLY